MGFLRFLKEWRNLSFKLYPTAKCVYRFLQSAPFNGLRGIKYSKSLIVYLMPPPSPSPPAFAHCYLLLDTSSAPVG